MSQIKLIFEGIAVAIAEKIAEIWLKKTLIYLNSSILNKFNMSAQIISLNVGKAKEVTWRGDKYFTGIFKSPVKGKRTVSMSNISGDEQGDLKHHGGNLKAIYSYDLSHYDFWNSILDRPSLDYGMFGENLTTKNFPDHLVNVGDVFEIGTTVIQALHPRLPCSRLNLRFNDNTILKQFQANKKFGIYFKVIEPGEIENNNFITLIEKSKAKLTIQNLTDCFVSKERDTEVVSKILENEILPESFKLAFQ